MPVAVANRVDLAEEAHPGGFGAMAPEPPSFGDVDNAATKRISFNSRGRRPLRESSATVQIIVPSTRHHMFGTLRWQRVKSLRTLNAQRS